jgi:alpha-beta hydrolase superfamily lysophospholipase
MDGPDVVLSCSKLQMNLKQGYSTISFDAPAHGKSPGKTTIMVDFITTILEIE